MPAFVATLVLRRQPYFWDVLTEEEEEHMEDHFALDLASDFKLLLFSKGLSYPTAAFKPLDQTRMSRSRAMECLLHDPAEDGENVRQLRASQDLVRFEEKYCIDVILQPDTIWRKSKRLVVFDMDSTLIQQEVIDEIAAFVGVKDQVAAITERAMRGELDFSESLRERCRLLRGVPASVFDTLKTNGTITFTPGARGLCIALKRMGCTLAVLSGGFQPLADWVKLQLGLDYAFANTLAVSDDGTELTGEVIGDIVDGNRKAFLLGDIARKEGLDLRQVVAVGDGANDLPMMHTAGFGVAFNAKPKVQAEAPGHLNNPSLLSVMYLFGISAAEQRQLLNPDHYIDRL